MTAPGTPVLRLTDVSISYRHSDSRWHRAVHDVSWEIAPGEVTALVGESGSGKSTTAQAVIGLLADNGRLDGGRIELQGTDIAGWSQRRLRGVRGAKVGLIPQDPGSSLNPVRTIGAQVGEAFQLHGRMPTKQRTERVLELLARVGLSDPRLRYGQYPHELSGGMRQRVLIAAAIALRPQLIIADEATSALDVTVQRRVLDLLDDLRREDGTAVLLVTHDLGVAADRSDRIVVMRHGRVQEQGRTADVLAHPESGYTARLLADAPSLHLRQAVSVSTAAAATPVSVPPADRPIAAEVRHLVQDFEVGRGRTFRAVDDLSFAVPRGTTHAIVGESGSGKTTTVRALVGFRKPTSGDILVGGTDVGALDRAALRRFRRTLQLVSQNPFASLDPRRSIGWIVGEPLLNFPEVLGADGAGTGRGAAAARSRRVAALLDRVGLPADVTDRTPRELSGGQRQRVAIARALVLEPDVVVLDEPVSALDVTVQAQILRLLGDLQRDLGLTYVFVSHDLAVVSTIADTVTVMSGGRQVESGAVTEVFTDPQHDYTRELIRAIPGGGRTA
ncbi:dipeptide ABC transporter ATP-binding protein [Nakamurella deserti]|uniref:dipeptide ABC transporter ATP-binding protein n=1 Tax=Nakamurella deserti TaxID=2164074 RepID=UPI000DBEA80A|nr:ABC transporter ATP-binding protein [Nakamurella deserti]